MRAKLLVFWCFYFIITFSYAKKEIQFFVDFLRFQNTEGKTYLEIFFSINPLSIEFKKNKNVFFNQTQITVTIALSQTPDQIILADKFTLTTELQDTSWGNLIIWDQKRYFLKANQSYRIEVIFKDLTQDSSSSYGVARELELKKDLFSDVLFFENIQKSNDPNDKKQRYGYQIQPLITNFTFFDADSLKFWLEIYQMDSIFSQPYFYEFYIIPANQEQKIKDTQKTTKTQAPKKFDVLLGKIPIKKLASQTYWLVIEIKTNDDKTLAIKRQKFFVYNSKDYLSASEQVNLYDVYYGYSEKDLDEYLKTLIIIATPTEVNFIQSLKTFEEKKNFFVNFWAKRVEAGQSPVQPWKEHLSRVQYANAKFSSTIRKGYITDRGRTLILYGPPNDIQSFTQDGDKYPYEIWFYNKLGRQQGVIFVFYDPDLITNEYPLLHSNKIGEFNNKSWRNDLLRGKPGSLGADDPEFNKIERTKFRDTLPLDMR